MRSITDPGVLNGPSSICTENEVERFRSLLCEFEGLYSQGPLSVKFLRALGSQSGVSVLQHALVG